MKELQTIFANKISADDLLDLPFAFACWRMPGTSEKSMVISLSGTKSFSESIENLPSGFVVNRFIESHPFKGEFIPADLVFKKGDLEVHPNVSSSQLDDFVEKVKSLKRTKTDKRKSIPTNETKTAFLSDVESALESINDGRFEKVVSARFEEVALPSNFSIDSYFDRICHQYNDSFCSLFHLPNEATWIGATPELLLSSNHATFKTVSLAGTKKLEANQKLAEIAWTQKEIEEQALVSRYIINCFKKLRLREFKEHGPKTIQAGHLAHLKTDYEVDKLETNFENLTDQMLDLLHPTSAVCGMPRKEALSFIQQHELYDREYFSGFLGPVNHEGETNLFVNLRCCKIDGGAGRFYAGAGITEDSIPEKELHETNLKIQILKSLI